LLQTRTSYAILTAIVLFDFSLAEQRGERGIGPILVFFVDMPPDGLAGISRRAKNDWAAFKEIDNALFLGGHSTR